MTYILKDVQPFSQGGNRLCFVLPGQADRCVKVLRKERTPEIRRAAKGFPKNLQPLSAFDENWQELQVMQMLEAQFPDAIFANISRCYGLVETDMGPGLCSELILDHDGSVSMSLQLYFWHKGYTESCQAAVQALSELWLEYGIPSRDLLVHNIVAQRADPERPDAVTRLVVIDGLGGTGLSSIPNLPLCIRRYFTARKVHNLAVRIDDFLNLIKGGEYPGVNGLPMQNGVTQFPEKRPTAHIADQGCEK